jgi:hypothetical protein
MEQAAHLAADALGDVPDGINPVLFWEPDVEFPIGGGEPGEIRIDTDDFLIG